MNKFNADESKYVGDIVTGESIIQRQKLIVLLGVQNVKIERCRKIFFACLAGI